MATNINKSSLVYSEDGSIMKISRHEQLFKSQKAKEIVFRIKEQKEREKVTFKPNLVSRNMVTTSFDERLDTYYENKRIKNKK